MSRYATDFDGAQHWDGTGVGIGYGESPIDTLRRVMCNRCGKGSLYWRKVNNHWRLHHWTIFGAMKRPGFVQHRCGFQSDGSPTLHEAADALEARKDQP